MTEGPPRWVGARRFSASYYFFATAIIAVGLVPILDLLPALVANTWFQLTFAPVVPSPGYYAEANEHLRRIEVLRREITG